MGIKDVELRTLSANLTSMQSPLNIGSVVLPNRFAMAPMTTNFATDQGLVTTQLEDHLATRARGGFGLVITENFGVHASGRVMPRMAMADRDECIVGMSRLAQAIKSHGARAFAQISHCGRQSKTKFTGQPLRAASAISCPINKELPLPLSTCEVTQVVQWFVDAALRIERAGFDGVEVHGAHGYLIAGFLSAYSNQRQDEYGGSLENRARLLIQIVRGIKACSRLALSVRISADELVQNGNTLHETIPLSRWLEREGVDAISVSVGVYESFNAMSMVAGETPGLWLPLAAAIKQQVNIPVMGVGRIHDATMAEKAVSAGWCDLPLFGRSAIADAELPRKALSGQAHMTLQCLACNVCLGRSSRPETICPMSPEVGRQTWFDKVLCAPTSEALSIAVLGTGLIALTAAWVAARQGHNVCVIEQSQVGGLQGLRAQVPQQSCYTQALVAARLRGQSVGVKFLGWTNHLPPCDEYWAECFEPIHSSVETLQGIESLVKESAGGNRPDVICVHKDLALDAYPGYRKLYRLYFERLGVKVIAGSAEVTQATEDAKLLHCSVDPSRVTKWIKDCYEPDQMTAQLNKFLSELVPQTTKSRMENHHDCKKN